MKRLRDRVALVTGATALAADKNVLEKSGKVFVTPALAREYGFTDINGSQQSPFWEKHWAGTWG